MATPLADAFPPCVERGVWTPVPAPAPGGALRLTLKAIDARAHRRCKADRVLTFHLTGCSGDFRDHRPQAAVAAALAAQVHDPGVAGVRRSPAARAAFLFHLGDVAYVDDDRADPERDDMPRLYDAQFYAPYAGYDRRILAIAGNHDGEHSAHRHRSAIDHFLAAFCARPGRPATGSRDGRRPAMAQPYVYWRLDTPLAHLVALYTNVANGGILDDPATPDLRPQFDWLVAQLADIRRRNAARARRRAVLLLVHYPPYSGAANFAQRGYSTLGPTRAATRPLSVVLRDAFAASGQRPDAVLAAHAHHYQRLTYRHADGWEVPYLIVGNGGHAPVESLWARCDGTSAPPRPVPFDIELPAGAALPPGDRAQLVAYNDRDFGFLRVTITARQLRCECFTVAGAAPVLADTCQLDLRAHRLG